MNRHLRSMAAGLALLWVAAASAQVPNPALRVQTLPKPGAAVTTLAPPDPQQAELARLKAEERGLVGQAAAKQQEIRGAQQAQWRGQRTCQGPLVLWAAPPQAAGTDFPRTAYDCSPYLCEAPGLCMAQCAPGQCAPGAECVKTPSGGVCVIKTK